jgi:hypothetical protein
MIIGNPPWIAMRYIENRNYQDFLKQQVLSYELLSSDQVHLFTQMESATLFYCRCSDLYLHDVGIISFVMPRSVLTGALHHANFKQLKKPTMKLLKIFDLEDVSPLFNVPSCVLASLKGSKTSYPVLIRKFRGQLPEKNVRLSEASKHLTPEDHQYEPPKIPAIQSDYHDSVKAGAAIYPRCFYFAEFDVHPLLGIDAAKPLVKTSEEVMTDAKEPWKSIRLHGNVESEFIFATLLGGDVVSFGFVNLRPIVLPIKPHLNGYRIFNSDILRNMGFPYIAEWLAKAQSLWETYRTEKSRKRFPRVLDRLDYNGLLSNQNPMKRYIVAYNTAGTNLCSCVIDRNALPPFAIGKTNIKPKGFVAETMTMYYETDNEMEAHYICAVLNSDNVNEAIKPFQTRGLFGERHIMRRPFMLPLPKFIGGDLHVKLAELSKQCHCKVASIEFRRKSAAGARSEARRVLAQEIEKIDELVYELLGL